MNLPKFPQTSTTERIGVMRVATILTEMGFIFRETSNSDTGIDGYIEEVNNNQEATGRLLATQIKSGASYLQEHDEYFVFHADESHIKYWKLYPIPVILCVHNPDTGKTYYQAIHPHGHEVSTKIMIPQKQVLSYENREDLFASIAGFSSAYHTTEELYTIMNAKRISTCKNSYVSFLVASAINLCNSLSYFILSLIHNKDTGFWILFISFGILSLCGFILNCFTNEEKINLRERIKKKT